jgi:hypothetical protein
MTTETTLAPKITGYSMNRQVWGHGESGFSISVTIEGMSGYDYADETLVRKTVDALNDSLKRDPK